MSYTSFNFLIFVTATILVYFLLPWKRFRWVVLLAASYVFYLFAGYRYAGFILFTTLSTYLTAIGLEKITARSKEFLHADGKSLSREEKKAFKEKTKRRKRGLLALALVVNFGILAFLKYYNFFAGSLNDLLGGFGMVFSAPTLKLALPLGISFYTFQSMGYLVDIYRDTVAAQKNFFKLALFVSFFPQIVQGPIGIYSTLANQLFEPHDFDYDRFRRAFWLILWGLFKKMAIADRAVIMINAVTDDYAAYGGLTLGFTIVLYSLQLYADFSGGIDISRGVAQIFGIDMMENFRRPYFSKDISEYWRRWHISLGNWFKNYLFYPLAMSSLFLSVSKSIKKSRFGATAAGAHIAKVLPTSIASFIVFFMVGVWHGANWKYVAFGVYNGGIIMLSVLLKPVFEATLKKLRIRAESAPYTIFRILRTYVLVLVGYVFDVAPDFRQSMTTFRLILTEHSFSRGWKEISALGLGKKEIAFLLASAVFLFIISVAQERHEGTDIRTLIDRRPAFVGWCVTFIGVMAVLVFGVYGSGYSAADFVYMQF